MDIFYREDNRNNQSNDTQHNDKRHGAENKRGLNFNSRHTVISFFARRETHTEWNGKAGRNLVQLTGLKSLCRFHMMGEKEMTKVYFIRHAESDTSVRDGRIRPLTNKGLTKRILVTEFLRDKNIEAVLSSPFKRAVDTVSDFAEKNDFKIKIVEDFREQKSSSDMRRDNPAFRSFLERQWTDFTYTFSDGECLQEVQERNISALNSVLTEYKDKNIAIGTHATALSVIINYYDDTYGFKNFEEMEDKLPWAVKMVFDELNCVEIEKIDL